MSKLSRLLAVVVLLLLRDPLRAENSLECTDDTFPDFVGGDVVVLVLFYSPECHYCQQFLPAFESAATELLLTGDPAFRSGRVNCGGENPATCDRERVEGFPELRVYVKGRPVEKYTGERNAVDVVKHVRETYGYHSKELGSERDLVTFRDGSRDVVLIGYFPRYTSLQQAFFDASRLTDTAVVFGHVFGEDVVGFENRVVLYRPNHLRNSFETCNVSYEEDADDDAILTFARVNYGGLVGHRRRDNVGYFRNPSVIVYYDVDYERNQKMTNYWRNRVLKVAVDSPRNVTFGVSSAKEFETELVEIGLDVVPAAHPIVVATDANGTCYVLKEKFSVNSLGDFVKAFNDGTFLIYEKPKTNYEKPETNYENGGCQRVVATLKLS